PAAVSTARAMKMFRPMSKRCKPRCAWCFVAFVSVSGSGATGTFFATGRRAEWAGVRFGALCARVSFLPGTGGIAMAGVNATAASLLLSDQALALRDGARLRRRCDVSLRGDHRKLFAVPARGVGGRARDRGCG